MKTSVIFITGLILTSTFFLTVTGCAQSFEKYFTDGTLRIDYYCAGKTGQTEIFLDELLREPYWGGAKKLHDKKDPAGNIRYNAYDKNSGKLLYSKGMSTLFQEWQSTAEAQSLPRAMSLTATMPFPLSKIVFEIEERRYETGMFKKIFSTEIDPKDYFIRPELRMPAESKKLTDNGASENHIDIVFIAEGYTESEKSKFYDDASRIGRAILSNAPFDKYQNKFNVYAVFGVSKESGTDIPGEKIYRNTVLNSSFYTFNIDRYLTTFDNKNICNMAANVPYDAVFVLVNSNIYGGGGFYNWYATGVADNSVTERTAVHEFGHSFAGLADEYYTSAVAYSDFYNFKTEPWEPNITTLVDFNSKWKNMLDSSTPVPTPRSANWQDKLGVFEGGGYVAKGIFSPAQDCIMNSGRGHFCPVCQRAIVDKIIEIAGN
ncbi:MAG: IgA Peptidase M64 [Prevotellaceae bacterium]|jgi:hypothetical protein|nr:IgA Peptidase M64 [Prevotellaceae bacterium]